MSTWFVALVAVPHLLVAFPDDRKPEEFTCSIEQPGYHILATANCGLKIWKSSQRGDPLILDYASEGVCAYQGLSKKVLTDIWEAVGIKSREKHQPSPAFFTSQGARITKNDILNDILNDGRPVFLIEGGQFQWPPVEVGFRNVIEGVAVEGKPVELETLAIVPPIFKVHNLATREETDALIEHAKPHFVRADVVYMDKDKGKDVNEFRTSLNYRPPHNSTPLLTNMEARAAQTTRMPPTHFENFQILYYKKGGYYHAHDDASQLQFYMKDQYHLRTKHYGYFDRMLTLFWYMNDVPKGGETNFPRAGGPKGKPLPKPYDMRKCFQGLMVSPIAGQAVLWYNMQAHGQVSPYALHAACAVEEGQKYAINVWIYNKPLSTRPVEWDPNHPRVKHLEELTGMKAGTNEQVPNAKPNSRNIKFVNKSGLTVKIYWQGKGSLQPMADALAPGNELNLQTFIGHTFVAKSGDEVVASCTVTEFGGVDQTCEITLTLDKPPEL